MAIVEEIGYQGPQGSQGVKGDQGDTGAQGATGAQGDPGDQGDTGAQGDQGDQGSQGDQGDQGAQGPQGDQGYQGEAGGSDAYVADVVLQRTDSNTIALSGKSGSSKSIYVADLLIDLSSGKTIDTDSASDYLISESGGSVSIGSTAFSSLTTGFNDYTILEVYLTNNNDCWNFSSPTSKDYRQSIILSDKSPTEYGGYMASSGEGVNARHIGKVILNSSRAMDGDYSLASAFNDIFKRAIFLGDGNVITSESGIWVWADTTAGSPRTVQVLIPEGYSLFASFSIGLISEDYEKWGGYRIYGDSYGEAVMARHYFNPILHRISISASDITVADQDYSEEFTGQVGAYTNDASNSTIQTDDTALGSTCKLVIMPPK